MTVSRRRFLQGAGAVVGGAWLGPGFPWPRALAAAEESVEPVVLRGAERKTMDALASRILPSDDTPGAHEAGCVNFIDKALANEQAHTKDFVLAGLAALGTAARERYGKGFAELRPEEQDEMVGLLASGEIAGWPDPGVDPRQLFETVRRQVIVGFLADPAHGGNREWTGWRAVGYPAPRHEDGYGEAELRGGDGVLPVWARPRRRPPGF